MSPETMWLGAYSPQKPPFGVRSCEVVLIHPTAILTCAFFAYHCSPDSGLNFRVYGVQQAHASWARIFEFRWALGPGWLESFD